MDEPALKAVFNFEIIRHENFTGIFFNTPLLSSSAYSESGWVIDKFKESVKMSTYLIGFVISNFKTLVGHSPKHGYRTEVAARPEAINAGEANLALSESMKIIDFFTDYFNMSYPLEKLSKIFSSFYLNIFILFMFISFYLVYLKHTLVFQIFLQALWRTGVLLFTEKSFFCSMKRWIRSRKRRECLK